MYVCIYICINKYIVYHCNNDNSYYMFRKLHVSVGVTLGVLHRFLLIFTMSEKQPLVNSDEVSYR